MNPIQHAFCQIRPWVENVWTRAKFGAFVNRLPTTLAQDYSDLQAYLSTLPENGLEFRRVSFEPIDTDRLVTAHDYIILLFNLRPNEIRGREGEVAVDKILAIVEEAEAHLLRHVIRCTNPNASLLESAGAYKLVMSQIFSTHTNRAGKLPNFKSKALFTIQDFNTELEAAGVPDFYCCPPNDNEKERIYYLYKQLPPAVKDMFFSPHFQGRVRKDIPLYIIRDFILFADEERWNKLNRACEKNKQEGIAEISEFLSDFLEFQRTRNNVSLGGTKKVHNKDPFKLNLREQAYLEICKPYKWLGKMWKDNPTHDLDQSTKDVK